MSSWIPIGWCAECHAPVVWGINNSYERQKLMQIGAKIFKNEPCVKHSYEKET